jgi:hypothetical protein
MKAVIAGALLLFCGFGCLITGAFVHEFLFILAVTAGVTIPAGLGLLALACTGDITFFFQGIAEKGYDEGLRRGKSFSFPFLHRRKW